MFVFKFRAWMRKSSGKPPLISLWKNKLNMSCPSRCSAPLPPLSNLIHACMFLYVMPQGADTAGRLPCYDIKCIHWCSVCYCTVRCVINEARLRTVILCIWELLNSLCAVMLLRKYRTEQLHLLNNMKWYSWDSFLYSNMNVYACWTDSFCWIWIRSIYIRLLDTLLCSVHILRFHGDKDRFILYHNPHL